MKKMLMVCALALGGQLAATAPARPKLVATVEFASFGDVAKKVTTLGTMINNPIVPTLMLGAGQQQLAQAFGRFRSDAPVYVQVYLKPQEPAGARPPAATGAAESDDLCDLVLIYPSAEGPARMQLSHPGSTKADDGTLHLLAGPNNPNERWVKFTADGAFCAIADTAARARRAIDDFAATAAARAARASAPRPLVRLEITGPGLVACATRRMDASPRLPAPSAVQSVGSLVLKKLADIAATEQKTQLEMLEKFARATLVVDLDDRGLTFDLLCDLKPGVPPPAAAGATLPPAALAAIPPDAPIFGALMTALQNGNPWWDEARRNAEVEAVANLLRKDLVADVRASTNAVVRKYAPLLEPLAQHTADFLRDAALPPAPTDWMATALAFDGAQRPSVVYAGEAEKMERLFAARERFAARIADTLARQWPGKGLLTQTADGWVVDWAAAIDVAAAESGLGADKETETALAAAKQTVASVLGGTKTRFTAQRTGMRLDGRIACPDAAPAAAGKSTAEARLAAALPEVVAARPGGVVYLPLYGLARDVVLPILAKRAPKKDAAQYAALISALPAAEADSALAGATWVRPDGSMRALLRITAGEVRNFGAAFNAFTAASMAASLDSDDECPPRCA